MLRSGVLKARGVCKVCKPQGIGGSRVSAQKEDCLDWPRLTSTLSAVKDELMSTSLPSTEETNMSKPQPSFPSYNRTPKHLGCLNTLQPNPRDEFRTCWGSVEKLLVDEELWNDHKKLIFFPVASAATCTDSHLEVDQRFCVERFI
ncbi:hypothetical protein Taro_054700 [Colocasia esculenta]|uniref:Uncharacterized protein n=1 Tax=Colocasia esculenta TaxID=4460 RepID=A0A843XQT8_COLES|nr:hypothetical protein [Colocasia esculenta]